MKPNITQMRKEKLQCPYCEHEQEFTSWDNIELTQDQDMLDKIINEELFTFECEDCGKKALIAFPCLFSDIDKRLLVWLIGDYTPDQKAALDEDLAKSGQSEQEKKLTSEYSRRIVGSINDLKEKLIISSDGLDDRIIEVLKMLCINEVLPQIMDYQISEVRYNKDENGRKFLVIVFADKDPSMIEINDHMYESVKDMFMDEIEKATPREGFAEINAFWAKDLIENTADDAEEGNTVKH